MKQAFGTVCHYKFKKLAQGDAFAKLRIQTKENRFVKEQISVKDYFAREYGLSLRFPYLQVCFKNALINAFYS